MATKKTKTNPGYLLKLPDEMMIGAKAMAETRGQTLADYIRAAVRMKLMADATNMEAGSLMELIAHSTAPINRATNFGSVHAAATLAFLREWAKDGYMGAGMAEDMAEEKAGLLGEAALDNALTAFEDPQIRAQFGWIERPPDQDA